MLLVCPGLRSEREAILRTVPKPDVLNLEEQVQMILGAVRGEPSKCINHPLVEQLLVRLAPGLYQLAVEGQVQSTCT